MSLGLLPVLSGLASALTWGAADFLGGLTAKRTSSIGIVILGHIGSLLLLVPIALLMQERLPTLLDMLISLLSGAAGGFGLLFFYRALAEGQMSLASPVAALVGTAIPVLVGLLTQDFPGVWMLIGLVLALVAIWLIAQTSHISLDHFLVRFRLPVLAGICFGIFFVGLHQASSQAIIWPQAFTRLGSIPSLLLFTRLTRQPWLPGRKFWRNIFIISLLDSAGNLFYVLSSLWGRLDMGAVVSSLYPGFTVMLAWLVLKEKISSRQWIGLLIALLALILFSI